MGNHIIRAQNIGKEYRYHSGKRRVMLRQALEDSLKSGVNLMRMKAKSQESSMPKMPQSTFWALRNISFEIKSGESVGIIGSNGAGKSTLLKILSRITAPSEGKAYLRGRVGSLLEVGTGFHPDLTGRENVYLNGSILGMRRTEIDRKFDEIVAFSEIEEFLDTPVKFFSSGMKMRLAFSVAAYLDPEILLIDEILSVGDTAFQKKSLNKMENVVQDGRTVLFVSHNMAVVRSLCTKGIFIENGEIKYLGEMEKAIEEYLHNGDTQNQISFVANANSNRKIQIMAVEFDNETRRSNRFPHDQSLRIKIKIAIRKNLYRFSVSLSILDKKLNPISTSYDFEKDEKQLLSRSPGLHTYLVKVPPILTPGRYSLSVRINQLGRKRVNLKDTAEGICPFDIYDIGSPRSRANIPWSENLSLPLDWILMDSTTGKPEK
ncbi:MAG: ABC transporter ATP-binding protein [Anaerolineae bacterium]|jgi:lipopolysaccharide transport system ATP-binding protein|nr:ABC transporter ATP-binding protein [Anaerolineae bacterium]